MEIIDLSYYRILPQQSGATPKILLSEITNEIEFFACTGAYATTIDFVVSKILELSGINTEPVMWGSDLKFYENNFVTLTKFDTNKEWLYYSDTDKLDKLKNKIEIDFSFLMASLLGGQMWEEDLVGFVDDKNNLRKSFHYNMMFEIELAMYNSGNSKAAAVFDRLNNENDFFDEEPSLYEDMKPLVDNFLAIKKSDWFNILKFPPNSKYEKCKFWSIKKINDAQKTLRKYYQ